MTLLWEYSWRWNNLEISIEETFVGQTVEYKIEAIAGILALVLTVVQCGEPDLGIPPIADDTVNCSSPPSLVPLSSV